MYGISEKQYSALESFIQIPTEEKALHKPDTCKTEKITIVVELNTADSAGLTKIKGIGAFFAKTIIKYRDLLGGFIAEKQLLDRAPQRFVVMSGRLRKCSHTSGVCKVSDQL